MKCHRCHIRRARTEGLCWRCEYGAPRSGPATDVELAYLDRVREAAAILDRERLALVGRSKRKT